MAIFLFTKAIIEGKSIDVYNNGEMKRDFTYIDDIIEGTIRIIDKPSTGDKNWNSKFPNSGSSSAPYKIYNIGNNTSVKLLEYISAIENALGLKAKKNLMLMQPGDVKATWANVDDLVNDFGYKPSISIQEGINKFVDWYKEFYK